MNCPYYKELPENLKNSEDIIAFPVTGFEEDGQLVTKMRPHLLDFFQDILDKFNIYFYTMGNRIYANRICFFIN